MDAHVTWFPLATWYRPIDGRWIGKNKIEHVIRISNQCDDSIYPSVNLPVLLFSI